MSFYEVIEQYKDFDFDKYWENVTDYDVLRSLEKDKLDHNDVLNLLSPTAEKHLEAMAQKAHRISIQNFGRALTLYTPMYIATTAKTTAYTADTTVTVESKEKN